MIGTSEKFRVFFEDALKGGEMLAIRIQRSMRSMSNAEVETLSDRAAEFYSGLPGDPVRHLIAEIVANEYGQRFNHKESEAASNVVAFPIQQDPGITASRIEQMAIAASMAATDFVSVGETLASAFIVDLDNRLRLLDDDALTIAQAVGEDLCDGETCKLEHVMVSDMIEVEIARRRALGHLRENGEDWPGGNGAA